MSRGGSPAPRPARSAHDTHAIRLVYASRSRAHGGMELTVALSNPSLGPLLARALQTVADLAGDPAVHEVAVADPPARSGQIIEAMKTVLADHPDGLRTVEVRLAVEA